MAAEPLEERLGCIGYWGFGTGYELAERALAKREPYEEGYCGRACGRGEECWFRHRGRVMFAVPYMAANFMALVSKHKADAPDFTREQMEAVHKEWYDRHGQADPFTEVLGNNIEDGSYVAAGQHPGDRGVFSLTWTDEGPVWEANLQ